MDKRWYDREREEVVEELGVNPLSGLSREEAAARAKRGRNVIYPVSRAPFHSYLRHIVTDFMVYLFLVVAILRGVLSHDPSVLVLFAVILLNYAVTVGAYGKAGRVLEEMSRFSVPSARVLRDGKVLLVKGEDLVPGDIIFLTAGDIVPADARLLEASSLSVLELGLTKNEGPVAKDPAFFDHRRLPPEERRNMLFASTIVRAGRGKAVVVATGEETLVSLLGKARPLFAHESLTVTEKIRRYSSRVSLATMIAVFAVTAARLLLPSPFSVFDTFFLLLTLSVSDMAELVSAFSYIVIAEGVFGAVKRGREVNVGALIKNSSKLDELRHLDTLAIPKESLFRESDMRVERLFVGGEVCDTLGGGEDGERLLRYAVISTGIYGARKLVADSLRGTVMRSATEEALLRAAERRGIYDRRLEGNYPTLERVPRGKDGSPFDTSLVFHEGRFLVILRGDAIALLSRCTRYTREGTVVPLSQGEASRFRIEATQMMRAGYRVIAIASRRSISDRLFPLDALQKDLIFEGLLGVAEPLAPGAALCLSRCRAAGIRVLLFCREATDNNKYLALSAGVARSENECVSLSQMKEMKEGLLRANLPLYNVYEGIGASSQRMILQWMRSDSGARVGVLARSLRDIALFSTADVKFAEVTTLSDRAGREGVDLSRRPGGAGAGALEDGCEAVKFASDVIVSSPDDDGNGGFSSVVAAIAHAGNITRNLLLMMRYLFCSQTARLLLLALTLASGVALLSPAQMLFAGLITDMLAVLVIAFDRPARALPVTDRAREALDHLGARGLSDAGLSLLLSLPIFLQSPLYRAMGVSLDAAQVGSLSFISLTVFQITLLTAMLLRKRGLVRRYAVTRAYFAMALLLASFFAAALLIPALGRWFGVVPFPAPGWIGVALAAASAAALGSIVGKIPGAKNKKSAATSSPREGEDVKS